MADQSYDQMPYGDAGQDQVLVQGGDSGGKRKRGNDSNATGRKRNRYIAIGEQPVLLLASKQAVPFCHHRQTS